MSRRTFFYCLIICWSLALCTFFGVRNSGKDSVISSSERPLPERSASVVRKDSQGELPVATNAYRDWPSVNSSTGSLRKVLETVRTSLRRELESEHSQSSSSMVDSSPLKVMR